MNSPFPAGRRSALTPEETLQRYIGEPFPTADYILLCCFGPEPGGQRTYHELRQALIQSGFTGPLVRHLISVSPVVRRMANSCYRLAEVAE